MRRSHSIRIGLALAAIFLASACAARQLTNVPGQAPRRGIAAPTLADFSPTAGTQGATVTLSFTGQNFRAPVLVQFNPATGLAVSGVSITSPTEIQVTLKIDPNAPVGPRQVLLTVADRSLSPQNPFTVNSQQLPCSTNALAAVPCQPGPAAQKGLPALRGYSPFQGAQGATVTLKFTGANLRLPTTVLFTPATGLTVVSVQAISAAELDAQVRIDAAAPLVQRTVELVVADHSLRVQPQFTITPGKACTGLTAAGIPCPPVGAGLRILRITPNQIRAGSQNVELKIEGTDFAPGAQVSFSTQSGAIANVFPIGSSRFVNSTEIHAVVNVLPAAIPGGRDVTITNLNNSAGSGKGLLNILPPLFTKGNSIPPKLKITPIAFQHFTEGKINLQAPLWGTQYNGADSSAENYGIPPLTDETVFQWSEQNPGTADYFELRVYASDGKTLIGTKRIDGTTAEVSGKQVKLVPTFYRADAAFLQQVLSATVSPKLSLLFPPWQPLQTGGSKKLVKLGYNPAPTPPASTTPQLPQGDLQWEVAGFHIYNSDGTAPASVAKPATGKVVAQANPNANFTRNASLALSDGASGQADIEVEISDRWPLAATQAPTGLKDCSKAAACGKGLQLTDVGDPSVTDSNGNVKPGAISPNDYVGDPFVLSGTFDLSRSPYSTTPTYVQPTRGSNSFTAPIQDFQFSNLFVDWGDGTVQTLSAPPVDPNNTTNWSSNVQLSLPACMPVPKKSNSSCLYSVSHVYNYPGFYNVRVFQLSNADVQQVNPTLVASSADGPAGSPYMAAGALSQVSANKALLTTATGSGSNPGQIAFQKFSVQAAHAALGSNAPSPSDIASRAYMIYCNQIKITTVEDPLADGPLYLTGIDNPDFGDHDVKHFSPAPGGLNRLGGGRIVSGASEKQLPAQGAEQGKTLVEKGVQLGNRLVPGEGAGPAPIAICSACDDSLMAQTELHYFGHGYARVTWHVDGGTWPPQSAGNVEEVGPSLQRQNLTRQEAANSKPGDAKITGYQLYSSRLSLLVKPSADHSVWVEAEVVPAPPPANLSYTVSNSIHLILSGNTGSAGASPSQSAAQQAQTVLKLLTPPANTGLPPLKVGFLSPSNHASPGMGAVQYVNSSLSEIAAGAIARPKGSYASSKPTAYEVAEADPKQPCKFEFPVKDGGSFEITGLQNHATETNGAWNGTGTLLFNLASENGYEQYPGVEIKIQNWQVDLDGTVKAGSFDASPAIHLAGDTPALTGTVDRLQGTAGQTVTATLSVQLTDKTVRLPGSGQVPQKWAGVPATLTSAGDWYAKGLALPESFLGWSGFTIQSNDVRLDLSYNDGDAPGFPCGGGSGAQWVGVRLGSATIVPYTMDLVGSSTAQRTLQNWGFDGSGVCGAFDSGPFTAQLEAGTVSFQSINATAQGGMFNAVYHGMDVHVPWLNTDLKGDPQLQSGGGNQASITFPLNGSAQPLNYANVTLKASNLQFTKAQYFGWAVQADTEWDLSAENKRLAQVKTNMFFGMDGRAYFKQANPSRDVSLGGTGLLNATPLELVNAHLTAPQSGPDVLDFAIQTKLHLSEVMPVSDVQINYSITKSSTQYSAAGPTNSPFMVDVPYPAGQPASEAKIHPTYSGGSNSEYSGTVDLAQLGGPPITGEFRLGYQGGHDYWLTRVTIGLGAEGVPLVPVPPVMNLYAIRGGLGHNFPLNAFSNAASLASLQPSMDGSVLFMAGLRVGMPAELTYMLDGDLTIKATGSDAGARMDFHAWLLTPDHSGNGNFAGYFQYAGNNFDGRVWGGLNFMNGLASFDLGNSASNAAIDLHFGGGSWHIYAGKKEGPRIQAHFIVDGANAYVMLGSEVGLAIGGDANFCLCVGDSSVASAYIKGDLDIGVQITPQPHFIGDASGSLSAGVCLSGVCVSGGISAQVHLEALPLDMHATATLGLPWPIGDVTFSAHI